MIGFANGQFVNCAAWILPWQKYPVVGRIIVVEGDDRICGGRAASVGDDGFYNKGMRASFLWFIVIQDGPR
jgi:hypothetical protein